MEERERKHGRREGGGSVMTDSGGNGIRSRVRFGVRGNEGVGSRTCLRGASEIGVTLVNASAAPSVKRGALSQRSSLLRHHGFFAREGCEKSREGAKIRNDDFQ